MKTSVVEDINKITKPSTKCASQSIFIFKNSFFSKSDGLTFQPDMIYFNLKYIGRNLGAGMLVALTIESI